MNRFVILLFLLIAIGSRAQGADQPPAATAAFKVIEASPEKGFHYPYILRIPDAKPAALPTYLLVEPNNTGSVSDDFNFHLNAAKKLAETAVGGFVSRTLNIPLLVPVFPRPETGWEYYTHLLDRDTLLIPDGSMRRLDLQLLAMIEDARPRLNDAGFAVHKKVLMTGFSASGTFGNRFAFLHPHQVQAVASGGVNGILMLPLEKLESTSLPYPFGLSDFEKIAGSKFQKELWKQIPQFIYMGADDQNDAVEYDDGYTEAERTLVHQVIGKKMQPDRWEHCQKIYLSEGANVTFRTYLGVGHFTDRKVNTEIAEFFRKAMSQ